MLSVHWPDAFKLHYTSLSWQAPVTQGAIFPLPELCWLCNAGSLFPGYSVEALILGQLFSRLKDVGSLIPCLSWFNSCLHYSAAHCRMSWKLDSLGSRDNRQIAQTTPVLFSPSVSVTSYSPPHSSLCQGVVMVSTPRSPSWPVLHTSVCVCYYAFIFASSFRCHLRSCWHFPTDCVHMCLSVIGSASPASVMFFHGTSLAGTADVWRFWMIMFSILLSPLFLLDTC